MEETDKAFAEMDFVISSTEESTATIIKMNFPFVLIETVAVNKRCDMDKWTIWREYFHHLP